MRKAKPKEADELRPEYQRSDFDTLVRGKYADRIKSESNVVVLEPTAESAARPIPRTVRARVKPE